MTLLSMFGFYRQGNQMPKAAHFEQMYLAGFSWSGQGSRHAIRSPQHSTIHSYAQCLNIILWTSSTAFIECTDTLISICLWRFAMRVGILTHDVTLGNRSQQPIEHTSKPWLPDSSTPRSRGWRGSVHLLASTSGDNDRQTAARWCSLSHFLLTHNPP